MDNLLYPAVVTKVEEEDGGGYVAVALDLKGCMADGDSPEAAIAHLKEAIGEWVDEAKRLGRRVPEPKECLAKANRERKALTSVIEKQSDLIDKQFASFKALRAELDRMKLKIDLLSHERKPEESETIWGNLATLITVGATAKRRSYGKISH